MLINILSALLVGWFLSLFGFDRLIIDGLNQLFSININQAGYYILFVLVAFLHFLFSGQEN